MGRRRHSLPGDIALFLIGVGYALGLQNFMRPLTADGVHFHPWSSEFMMQTVSLRDLRHQPLETLSHIHIQPPAFDALRAGLAQFWPRLDDQAALTRVDLSLYVVGALLLGLTAAVVHRWLFEKSGTIVALTGSLLMLLHPAAILFATFLDSTLLSAFLVLGVYYLLWRIKNQRGAPIALFSAAVLALFFTRSLFQWPAMLLFATCLLLFRMSRPRVIVFLLLSGMISGAYVAKQYYQFGTFATSSFSGLNLANSIGVGWGSARYASFLDDLERTTKADPAMPDTLTAAAKINGQPNFNHIDYLDLNRYLLSRYWKALRNMPVNQLASNYLENARIYFRPSSTYSSGNVIIDNLPWTRAYDRIFSAPVLPALLMIALLGWSVRAVRAGDLASSVGMLLPGLYVMLVSIVGDKGENMRFKFFLEPVMVVFLVSELAGQARQLGPVLQRRRRPHQAPR